MYVCNFSVFGCDVSRHDIGFRNQANLQLPNTLRPIRRPSSLLHQRWADWIAGLCLWRASWAISLYLPLH